MGRSPEVEVSSSNTGHVLPKIEGEGPDSRDIKQFLYLGVPDEPRYTHSKTEDLVLVPL